MFCNYCGSELSDKNSFCTNCGMKVGVSSENTKASAGGSGFFAAGDLDGMGTRDVPRREVTPYQSEQQSVPERSVTPEVSGAKSNSDRVVGFGTISPEPGWEKPVEPYPNAASPNAASPYATSTYVAPPNAVPPYENGQHVTRTSTYEMTPRSVTHTATPVSYDSPSRATKKNSFANMIVLACCLLFGVVFLPMYNAGLLGELFPGDFSISFLDVMEALTEASNPMESDPVFVTVVVGVLGILLLLFACLKSKVMCIIISLLGTLGMFFVTIYYVDEIGADYIFATEGTVLCLGYWYVFLVFVVSFISSLTIRKNK